MTSELTSGLVPTDPAVRRQWILGQLRLRGLSLRKIAEAEAVSPQAVSAAISAPSEALERALAAALDLTPEELFPERFFRGRRIHQVRGKGTKSRSEALVRNGVAA